MFRALLLLVLCAPVPNAVAAPLDRVVVVVESELVMESQVRLEAALAPLDQSPSPFWDARRSTPLGRLVEAAVFRLAATDVALYQPETDDVVVRRELIRQAFRNRASWNAFLTLHGLDEASLDVVIRRRMIVERYLRRNLQLPPDKEDDLKTWTLAMQRLEQVLEQRMRVRLVPEQAQ